MRVRITPGGHVEGRVRVPGDKSIAHRWLIFAATARGPSALVEVPAEAAYAFLVDPAALGRWSLGCMDVVHVGSGIYRGRSLFDGGEGWLSIDGDPKRLVIDYPSGSSRSTSRA